MPRTLLLLLLAICALTSGCSLVLPFRECSKDLECPEGICQEGVCQEPKICAKRTDCATAQYCLIGVCRTIDTSKCARLGQPFVDKEDTMIIPIGSLMPLSGLESDKGNGTIDGADIALQDINKAGAGLERAVFGLITCDTGTDAGIVKDKSVAAAEYLTKELGVRAIIGAISSDVSIEVARNVTISHDVLLISPASTSPAISSIEDSRSDLVWRTIASDTSQAPAMTKLVDKYVTDRATRRIALIFVDSAYGQGFSQKLTSFWQTTDMELISGDRYKTFRYKLGNVESDAQSIGASLFGAQGFLPDAIILIGSNEAQGILRSIESTYVSMLDDADKPLWVLSEALRGQGLLVSNEMSLPTERIRGTVILQANTSAYTLFKSLYESAFKDNRKATDFPFADKAWDAAFLIALATASQSDPFNVTGTALAKAVRNMVRGDTKIDAISSSFPQGVSRLKEGQTIDFEGASGSLDFDANGDTYSDIAEWSVAESDGTKTFVDGDILYTAVEARDE